MKSVCLCGVPYSLDGNPDSGAIVTEKVNCDQSEPVDQWPKWALVIAKFRKPGDVGVGDTFHRIAERFGAERVIERLGLKGMCGCQGRHESWNKQYAYADGSS